MQFFDTSTAGSGTFTNNGGAVSGASGGFIQINNTATAGNATLIANGGFGGGAGGSISLSNGSSGGTARVEVFGNGRLDISGHNTPGVTVGSIEGSGAVILAANNLTVGSNNLTTIFSGTINGGGSLTKIGSGTLALSGANTYTGGTQINAGSLLANNSSGSATSSGAVIVTNGGSVLGGIGTIGGSVTINTDAALLGGDATMASGALSVGNDVILNSGSIIKLVLGASGAHSSVTRTGGTWTFAANQKFTFLDVGAQPGAYDNIITGLAGDPGGTASWTITNAGFAGTFTYDGAGNIDLNLTAVSTPLQVTTAASRKIHAGAGNFDIPLPLSGNPGVECRNSGGNHTLVFTFNHDVVSGNASVTTGTGAVSGSPTFVSNTMTVSLTGVTDVQTITVTLSSVTDSFAQILPDTAVSAGFLICDTNGDRFVNVGDTLQTRNRSGQATDATNFRSDVNMRWYHQ